MVIYDGLFTGKQHIQNFTCNTPIKNSGDIYDSFSTARRDVEIMLNICPNTNEINPLKN